MSTLAISDSSLDLDIPILRPPSGFMSIQSGVLFLGVPLLLIAGMSSLLGAGQWEWVTAMVTGTVHALPGTAGLQVWNNRGKGTEEAEDPIEKMSTAGILAKLYQEVESKVGGTQQHK